MARMYWTLCEEDAKEYDLPGPQVFDTEALESLRADALEELERVLVRQLGMTLFDLIAPERESAGLVRAIMWVSLRMAGHTLAWEEFRPQTLKVSVVEDIEPGGDSHPPALGPDGP